MLFIIGKNVRHFNYILRMKPFDPLSTPLEGINLIDASAGTGKTHTICDLILRLLIEKELLINQILVVTYTEAATEDLRNRVRARLSSALDLINSNGEVKDQLLHHILEKHAINKCRKILEPALSSFDEASIFTIHGFCQRMLRENSFESGALFDTELIADDSFLKKEISEDFWRKNFTSPKIFSKLFLEYIKKKMAPGNIQSLTGGSLGNPDLVVIPLYQEDDVFSNTWPTEKAYLEKYTEVHLKWEIVKHDVSYLLMENDCLNRNKYRKKSITSWLYAMDALPGPDSSSPFLFDKFNKFTTGSITAACKKGCAPPKHLFFDLCEQLLQLQGELLTKYEICFIALKSRLHNYIKKELTIRKSRSNIYSFDDLLIQLRSGLSGPGGPFLANLIKNKYPAALIDEFQDTDPIQYEIFNKIYTSSNNKGSTSLLYLIGDPKQAIYSFRGADIFAYIQAISEAETCQTLTKNWRSVPALITAVNTIFSVSDDPFIFPEIPFESALPAVKDHQLLTINGSHEPPLQFWFYNKKDETENKPILKNEARSRIINSVANEIVDLLKLSLEGRANLGNKKLTPGDIAILVRTNREARTIQTSLTACKVPSVLHSAESVFVSNEAYELEQIIVAIAEPGSEHKIKSALLADIIGMSIFEISILRENELEWEKWLNCFQLYHNLWNSFGFMKMFRTFMAEQGTKAHLLKFSDGERRLTNLLHLTELLHKHEEEHNIGIPGVIHYFAEKLNDPGVGSDEEQLRLESDAERVQIVTIHKAKGLQYPVVFCPFLWEGLKATDKKEILFHEKTGDKYRQVLDLGSPEFTEHLSIAAIEELAENLRLLYVALTRAQNRCYLAWGAFKGAETSALTYLLHQKDSISAGHSSEIESVMKATAENFRKMTDTQILADLTRIVDLAGKAINLKVITESAIPSLYSPDQVETDSFVARDFSGSIIADWRITSFSSLVSGFSKYSDMPDRDSILSYTEDVENFSNDIQDSSSISNSPQDMYTFPRGIRTGNFLHDLLENLDFTCKDNNTFRDIIRTKLSNYGFENSWENTLFELVINLISTSLLPKAHYKQDLLLSNVNPQQCLKELEFYFPLSRITAKSINEIFVDKICGGTETDSSKAWENLNFNQVHGFMKGYIDLVFESGGRYFIIDWKSNYLGANLESYHSKKLTAAMKQGFYSLQYHLYTLALHKYLENRINNYGYESHFGGVMYIFLRGLNKQRDPDFGIFFDLPCLSLIREMEKVLIPDNKQL